ARSIQTGQAVVADLAKRLPATLELAVVTMLVYIGLAVPLGILAAVTRGRWPDLLIRLPPRGGLAPPPLLLGSPPPALPVPRARVAPAGGGPHRPESSAATVRHRLLPRGRAARRRLVGP